MTIKVLPEERVRLENFLSRRMARKLLRIFRRKHLPLYNICPYEGKIGDLKIDTDQGLWFRVFKPKSQLAFVVYKEDKSYFLVRLKNRILNNNPIIPVSQVSDFVDFISSQAG